MLDGNWRGAVDKTTQPVGRTLARIGVGANALTAFGVAMSVVTAFVVGSGHLLWGMACLFPTGLPDLFDGPVAKAAGTASQRGAFFDSVADRVADAFLFGGVAWYLVSHHHGQIALLPLAILAVTFCIAYERSKGELLGVPSKGGLMERAERFILLGAAFLSPVSIVPILWVFLALVSATAINRFIKIWRAIPASVRLSVAETDGTLPGEPLGEPAITLAASLEPIGSSGRGATGLASPGNTADHRRDLVGDFETRLRLWREARMLRSRTREERHATRRDRKPASRRQRSRGWRLEGRDRVNRVSTGGWPWGSASLQHDRSDKKAQPFDRFRTWLDQRER